MKKLLSGVFAASIALSGILGGAAAIGATSVQAAVPCDAFHLLNHIACDSQSFYNSGISGPGGVPVDSVPSQAPAYSGHMFSNSGQLPYQP